MFLRRTDTKMYLPKTDKQTHKKEKEEKYFH